MRAIATEFHLAQMCFELCHGHGCVSKLRRKTSRLYWKEFTVDKAVCPAPRFRRLNLQNSGESRTSSAWDM
jgi:hypothetical protein